MIFKKKIYIKGMELRQNKTRRTLTWIASLAIGMSLCACGSENVAGGGPSGTEAGNAITAQILIANAPAAYAQIKLVKQTSLDGDGYTATANDSGFVTIEKIAQGNYTMEASLDGSALQLPVNIKDSGEIDLGKQSLQKTVYIGGSVTDFIADSDSARVKNMTGSLKFRGLDHSTTITNGKFEISGLPAGNLNMVFIPKDAPDTVNVSVDTDAGDSITTIKSADPHPVSHTLLIDDFEDGDNHHLLAPKYTNNTGFDGVWALTFSNITLFQITPAVSSQNMSNPFVEVIQDDGNGGKEVHFSVTFPDTNIVKQQWACFSVSIGNQSTSYDLSSIDSIAFDAWGDGSGSIQITDENRKDVDPSLGIYGFISGNYPIELSANKKRFTIAFADILPNEDERKSISSIAIVFHSDVELHFDNLTFIGDNPLDIWKPKE